MRARQDSGQGNSQSGDMGQRIEISRAGTVAHPQALLAGSLEAGIVSLALGTQGIDSLKIEAAAVNGKPVVRGDGLIFGAAPVLLSIVPILVAAGTGAALGVTEGTAELLAETIFASVKNRSILTHGKASVADKTARGQFGRVLCISFIQWDNGIALINFPHQIVDILCVVTFVTQKGTLPEWKDRIGGSEDLLRNGRICHVGRSGQFIERQTGNAVHQHMTLVSPVKLKPALVVLVAGGVYAQGTVRITFGWVILGEFVISKGLWVVLLGVGHHCGGVQSNEGSVQNPQLIQLPDQVRHDRL